MKVLSDFEPQRVFKYFEEICAIPHGSGNTRRIREYLVDFAAGCGLKSACDDIGNVIIYKPASPGYEGVPAIILQGHMDMVAVATPESGIDMTSHKLELQVEGDYLSARNTSLGGDDGIAVAMILALLESDSIQHPPIEALFTMDEETGMDGAKGLDTSLLQGKRLINIDSEEEGYIYAGCAGGARVYLDVDLNRDFDVLYEDPKQSGADTAKAVNDGRTAFTDEKLWRIDISGCTGGHSGSEIDKGRANANILAGRILYEIVSADTNGQMHNMTMDESKIDRVATIKKSASTQHNMTNDTRLISVTGGHVDNAIPTDATLVFLSGAVQDGYMQKLFADIKSEYGTTDPDMEITLSCIDEQINDSSIFAPVSCEQTARIAAFLMSMPNGVQSMCADMDGLVETSLNLGVINTYEDRIVFQFSVRSSVESAKKALIGRLRALADISGAGITVNGDYPGWTFRKESPLRDHMAETYRKMRGEEPVIKAIHAGLECGFFVSTIPGLDCVSIGPDMYDVHTTKEHLSISSVKRTWEYLCEVLKTIR